MMNDGVHPGVRGLSGGSKQFWLRTHRREVENYYSANGPDDTLVRFNMRQSTLQRFFERQDTDYKYNKLSEGDRMVMRICQAGNAEVRRRVEVLEDWVAGATPIIEFGRSLLTVTVGQIQGKVGKLPVKTDALSLADFSGKSEK